MVRDEVGNTTRHHAHHVHALDVPVSVPDPTRPVQFMPFVSAGVAHCEWRLSSGAYAACQRTRCPTALPRQGTGPARYWRGTAHTGRCFAVGTQRSANGSQSLPLPMARDEPARHSRRVALTLYAVWHARWQCLAARHVMPQKCIATACSA